MPEKKSEGMNMKNKSSGKIGYSLKKQKLKKWIYEHNRTQPFVARQLGIEKAELIRKLNEREPFNQDQIRALVYLVGAEAAFQMIYFPTLKEKREVFEKAFNQGRKEKKKG